MDGLAAGGVVVEPVGAGGPVMGEVLGGTTLPGGMVIGLLGMGLFVSGRILPGVVGAGAVGPAGACWPLSGDEICADSALGTNIQFPITHATRNTAVRATVIHVSTSPVLVPKADWPPAPPNAPDSPEPRFFCNSTRQISRKLTIVTN